jgi:hypothetical protein
MEEEYQRVVGELHLSEKNFSEIVEIFSNILNSLFKDNNYSFGRLVVVEAFARDIVRRSKHIDAKLLYQVLKGLIIAKLHVSKLH